MKKRFDVEKIKSKKTLSHLDICKVIYEQTKDMELKKEWGDLITKYGRKEIGCKMLHRSTLNLIMDNLEQDTNGQTPNND